MSDSFPIKSSNIASHTNTHTQIDIMEAVNRITQRREEKSPQGVTLSLEDKSAMGHMRFAQGFGASLRYANELRAVQQVGRLAPLKSSRLHEEVLRGRLSGGP